MSSPRPVRTSATVPSMSNVNSGARTTRSMGYGVDVSSAFSGPPSLPSIASSEPSQIREPSISTFPPLVVSKSLTSWISCNGGAFGSAPTCMMRMLVSSADSMKGNRNPLAPCDGAGVRPSSSSCKTTVASATSSRLNSGAPRRRRPRSRETPRRPSSARSMVWPVVLAVSRISFAATSSVSEMSTSNGPSNAASKPISGIR